MRAAHQPLLLLVEHRRIAAIAALADCKVEEFAPYLKRHKALAVFGFGGACNTTQK